MTNIRKNLRASPPAAIGTGLLALDVVFAGDRLTPIGRWAGGTFGNVMAILSYLGWHVYPISRLRDDDEAALVLKDLVRWGIDPAFISQEPSGATPVIIEYIRQAADGSAVHKFSLRCPVCGSHLPSYRPVTASHARSLIHRLPTHDLFFFDRPSRGALDLATHSADSGAIVFFEPSGRGNPAHFKEALELAHVVKFSCERFRRSDILPQLRSAHLAIETLGEDGVRFAYRHNTHNRLSWTKRKAYRVGTVRDAAGCGDWFTAGVAHLLCQRGLSSLDRIPHDHLEDAIATGQALASWNALYEGARGGMEQTSVKELWHTVDRIKTDSVAEAPESHRNGASATRKPNHHFCEGCRRDRT